MDSTQNCVEDEYLERIKAMIEYGQKFESRELKDMKIDSVVENVIQERTKFAYEKQKDYPKKELFSEQGSTRK